MAICRLAATEPGASSAVSLSIRATAIWGEHPISSARSLYLLFELTKFAVNLSERTSAAKVVSGPLEVLIYPR
jgi:hypothetical protein